MRAREQGAGCDHPSSPRRVLTQQQQALRSGCQGSQQQLWAGMPFLLTYNRMGGMSLSEAQQRRMRLWSAQRSERLAEERRAAAGAQRAAVAPAAAALSRLLLRLGGLRPDTSPTQQAARRGAV